MKFYRRLWRPGIIVILLLSALLTPLTAAFAFPTLTAAVIFTLGTCAYMWWPRADMPHWWRRVRPGTNALLMQLSPVLLLTATFPFATTRMIGHSIDRVALPSLLLASSLTVPWLSQAVCLPLYRGIGTHIWKGDMQGARKHFCVIWPTVLAQSLPVALLFTALVEAFTRWTPRVLGSYLMLLVLHMVFVQSLVMTNVGRRRLQWALAWAVYAAALLIVPTWWWLPPLAGMGVAVWGLREHVGGMRRPVWLERREVYGDLSRGVVSGSVLWSDKLFLYLDTGGRFPVQTVFIALLPAVIVYNYYFVRLAPPFDQGVNNLRQAMQGGNTAILEMVSEQMVHTVRAGLTRAGLLAASLSLLVLAALGLDKSLVAAAPVAVASFLFLMIAIACYKLEYIGRTGITQSIGAGHLVLCVLAFNLADSIPVTYAVLIAGETVLLAVALRAALQEWRNAEYSLFWRHATAW